MMDMGIVNRIEKLLDYPQDISQVEINKRMAELEACFRVLYPQLPEFDIREKSIFVSLLTRANDLMRRSMENLMTEFNLDPQKLKNLEQKARQSNDPTAKAFISMIESLNSQAEALKQSIASINTKFANGGTQGQVGPSSAEKKRVKRSGWYKP